MLNAVIRFSLHNRLLVLFVSIALLAYGGYVAATLPIDVFPDLDRPRVVVMTEAPGLAPEEVETLITFPLESALLGATGVQSVRSQSAVGLSVVYVEFDWSTNIHLARQTVQERLTTISGEMPAGVKPQMGPISSIMGQIMHVGLYRRTGPRGGLLTPIGKTGNLAELVVDDSAGKVSIHLWNPRDREHPDQWQPVKPSDREIKLTWGMQTLTLPASGDGFSAIDPKLNNAAAFASVERRTIVTVGGRAQNVAFPSDEQAQMELRTTADWVIRPRLLKIAGIAQVVTMGGARKQYQVLIDPTDLQKFHVRLDEVEKALRDNNVNASGGFAIRGEQERPVRFLGRLGPAPAQIIQDLRDIPVKTTDERTITVDQLARVVEGPQLKRGDASVNGQAAVILTITKQPHTDTRLVTREIVAALDEIEATLPADVVINSELFQLKKFIDTGVFNVGEALVLGAVLVLIILFIFLLNFRTTFISLTAIPLSLVITALVFRLVGWLTGTALSINVMTLGGIAVAMGELVDDAIVDVENIFRRLKENNAAAQPRSPVQVIYEASVEVRGAIVFGTIMVIIVFIPLFALSGIEGRLFAPLGVAYIVSILASLLVSLTVTPVLSLYLLPQAQSTHHEGDSPLLRWLKRGAAGLIRFSMAHAGRILLVSWLLVGLGVFTLTRLGADFLPPFDEGSVQVNVTLPPGSSLEASNRTAAQIDGLFASMRKTDANPQGEFLQFSRRTGRAELDEHAEPVSNTEYILSVNPGAGRQRDEVIEDVLKKLKDTAPGVDVEVEQPLAHLISHMLSGVTAQIAIKVYGDDLDTLRQTAERIKASLAGVEGISPPVIESQRSSDELHLRVKPEQLKFYGIDRAAVAEFVSVALKGEEITQALEGQRRFDVIIRLDEPYRSDFTNLARLQVPLPNGRTVPLGELVYIEDGAGPNAINRENARRRIVIRCNALGRDLASVVADIQTRVRALQRDGAWPAGYAVEYGGQFESQRRATLLISGLAFVSFAGMFVVLYMLYPSVRIVLQILNALPTAFVGGVLALLLTGQTLTVASMVGFISLGGIAARNGILLVSHYFHLMKYEKEGFTAEMVMRGSLERLAPVLMTALTAGIALVPLVVVGHAPGREILYPVATVILGGLITSTLCEYLVHPGIFWRFSGQDAERLGTEG